MTDNDSVHVDGRNEEEIRELVLAIIAEIAPNKTVEIREDLRLIDDLGFHSLALLELAFTLEDEFDLLPITEEDARSITTVNKVFDHVLLQLRDQAGELA